MNNDTVSMRAWIDYYVMGHRNTFIRNRAQGGLWGIYVEGDQNQFLDNLLTGWNGVLGWDGVDGTRNAWLRNTIVDTENSGPGVFFDIWGDCTHNRWQRNVASASGPRLYF